MEDIVKIQDFFELTPEKQAELMPNVLGNKIHTIKTSSQEVENAIEYAKKALEIAENAKNKDAGWSFTGKKKEDAINALQALGMEQANAICNLADAQRVLFKSITDISDATTYLYGLGATNIATTRVIIKTITSDLNGASKETISEKARESLMGVLQQLKAQEDLHNKVEKCTRRYNELRNYIDDVNKDLTKKIEDASDDIVSKANQYAEEFVVKTNSAFESKVQTLSDKNKSLTKLLYIVGGVAFVNLLITLFLLMK